MSHLKERSEKKCLNCGAQVVGRFCHVCGQENLEPVETAWHLITHFFQDITHFDGKFFSTLKHLITRPGFLSIEYKKGKRASYLNPVRMYLFTSAIFFLIFFSFNHVGEIKKERSPKKLVEGNRDSAIAHSKGEGFHFSVGAPEKNSVYYTDSSEYEDDGIFITGEKFKDRHTYDSLLKSGSIKHNWLKRFFVYKEIDLREKYKGNREAQFTAFINNLLHSFPQMLFISLPLFALLLKMLYIRRKEFYYADHAIFSIHLYVFVFIMLLVTMGIGELNDYLNWTLLKWVIAIVIIYIFYYQYKSMRKFYVQGGGKTFLKFLILNLLMLLVIALLFIIFMIFSLMKL